MTGDADRQTQALRERYLSDLRRLTADQRLLWWNRMFRSHYDQEITDEQWSAFQEAYATVISVTACANCGEPTARADTEQPACGSCADPTEMP